MAVYFIQANQNGPVKIGTAEDVIGRLRELQTAHYMTLRLLREIDGDRRIESALHKQFASLRIRGEWFAFHPDMMTVTAADFDLKPTAAVAGNAKLRAWLNDSRLSESEFGGQIGTSQAAVNRYCQGIRVPRGAVMKRIVAATNGAIQPNDFYA